MVSSFNRFPEIAAKLKPALQQGISKVATDLEAMASGNAPVRTGFLASSVYSVTPNGSTYGSAGTPPGDSYLLPQESPPDDMSAIVGVAANYGIFLEMGTRFMPAQPYFYPAVESARGTFEAEMATALEQGLSV